MAVPVKLSLDALLQMSSAQVQETMRRLGSSADECSRITAALSCLKSTTTAGRELRDEGIPWIVEPTSCDINAPTSADPRPRPSRGLRTYSPKPARSHPIIPSAPGAPRSVSVSAVPSVDFPSRLHPCDGLPDPFQPSLGYAQTPPITPSPHRTDLPKAPCTPPPPSNKRWQLFPAISLPRSKSHTQLANRVDDPAPNKNGKKNKLLLNMQVNGGGSSGEDFLSQSSQFPARSPYTFPVTPTFVDSPLLKHVQRSSPQNVRRDYGLSFTHRFSTKSWLSQTCAVCHKNMMFGVKCKHCKLKCHNRCTKEAPQCHLPFRISKIRRTESVPSDINNQVELLPPATQFGTLPKTLTRKDQPPSVAQPDSSSNPSSTTSSTPSSPAAFCQSNPPSATPPPNPSPKGPRDNSLFCFPDVSRSTHTDGLQDSGEKEQASEQEDTVNTGSDDDRPTRQTPEEEGEEEEEEEEEAASDAEDEGEEDELDELPDLRDPRKGPISRKHSQTSVYLQEWDVPFEQLELGELVGKGRWGPVHRGRWHGEVAVRLMEIDGNNQGHLKLFKKEVMNYRQTRHENVVLFMGACMNPPQLAIITSFCKGRTLFSVVRDPKNTLDINKTRQIAQEIVKGMGYLHAKDIVHKDLKSKNVFYDSNKVVITDFGLFGMSGVVQEDRRENELKLPRGWIYYLAPEIVQKLCPGAEQDRLPFSKAADVYAFGTIWYELQARDWPLASQPAEAALWQLGSGKGVRQQLTQVSLGKEVTEILSVCWSLEPEDRPTFSQLADLLEKLPKLNRRLSHPGHFWKSAEPSQVQSRNASPARLPQTSSKKDHERKVADVSEPQSDQPAASCECRFSNEEGKDPNSWCETVNDPALWPCTITDQAKSILVSRGETAFQNRSAKYPASVRDRGIGGTRRSFTNALLSCSLPNGQTVTRQWLLYSPSTGCVYCFACKLFSSKHNTFVHGFSDWKHSERIGEHEGSVEHRACMLALNNRSRGTATIDSDIVKQIDAERQYWREVLKRVVAVIQFLGERSLAFRGDDELLGSAHNGNFLGIIELLAKFDPFLAEHLQRFGGKGKGSVSYLSSTVCEEFIHLMGQRTKQAIVNEFKESKYFSVIVDSTPDLAHVDLLLFSGLLIMTDM
ncbi:kinase suppressor of Ras 1-like isoform X2 [Brachyhypopomus gauderio]|uniref:kinase suppressor of Ras 1-like isoform X2 n=1 Tax=Brachyhypopomus gauderio TaxID=698409 RepID=UPI0040435C25